MWILSAKSTTLLILVFGITYGKAQEDSLRSALNAVDRRERDLNDISDYSENDPDSYYYSPDDNDLAFLKPTEHADSRDYQRALANYIEEEEDRVPSEPNYNQESGIIKKRFSSSFRERIENDKTKEHGDELADLLLSRLENEHDYEDENEQYVNVMNKLSKAYNNAPEHYESQPKVFKAKGIKKDYADYYPNLGYAGSMGLKKRSRYYEPDGPSEPLYLVNYTPKNEILERLHEEDLQASNDDWNQQDVKQEPYPHPYSMKRYFSVSKRGGQSMRPFNEFNEHKRASKRNIKNLSTDPKVVKELSSVFGLSQSKSQSKTKRVIKRNNIAKNTTKKNSTDASKKENETTKEVVPNVTDEEQLQIKKKSVNWEDYFGYDRKKKNNDLDHEWLMERYHKAIATSSKRSADYPLINFRNHEEEKVKKDGKVDEQEKYKKMDDKLKYIEDVIVDDALKYTGAHEGATDSKEIQEIKNKVISRLAAAYNLEKMRQALGEYKQSIKQQKLHKELGNDKFEEKRVSVPRKQAVDEGREKTLKEDNNIKCALEGGDCDERTYKTPKEILERESLWTRGGECPKIEKACNEVSEVLGNYGPQLKQACYMHQACLLCGSNSWFAPTRECNILYIAKADELCEDNRECEEITRHSIRYLLEVNRSLRAEPTDGCDLVCSGDRL